MVVVVQSCLTLCDPMDCSVPTFSVLHYFPEFAQIPVDLSRWCHPTHLILCHLLLLLPSIFPSIRVGSSHHQSVGTSSSVLPMNIHYWFPLGLTDLISLQSEGLSRVFSNTTVQKHQFFRAQASLWSKSLIHTWPLEKSQLWLDGPLLAKLCLLLFSSIFEKTLLFFRVAMPIYISVNSAQTFPFLYILTNTWYFFLMIAILIGVR